MRDSRANAGSGTDGVGELIRGLVTLLALCVLVLGCCALSGHIHAFMRHSVGYVGEAVPVDGAVISDDQDAGPGGLSQTREHGVPNDLTDDQWPDGSQPDGPVVLGDSWFDDDDEEAFEPKNVEATPPADVLEARLDAYLNANFPKTGLPGVAVAVVDTHGTLYERTLGDCTDTNSTFIIGSLSKSFTAIAVMQLVDQGRVDLDLPVSTYLPDCGEPDSVTVRSLLNQTSGFGFFDSLADARPGQTVGSFSYSNANYDYLGKVIERVSGQSYAAYLSDNVFRPLGMDDASIDPDAGGSVALGHRNWFGLNIADGYVHEDGDDAWGGPSSGYVRASLSDMERYLRMYLNGGDGVLNAVSMRRLALSRVCQPGSDMSYGMGWFTYFWDNGEMVMTHDGDVENYVAHMVVLPSRGIAIVLMGNAGDVFGGNDAFFQMADGVNAIAVGSDAAEVDGSYGMAQHAGYDLLYVLGLGAALWGLVSSRRWLYRLEAALEAGKAQGLVARAVVAHVLLPACLPWIAVSFEGNWRDFSTFVPDAALVVIVLCVLLSLGGVLRLAGAWRAGLLGGHRQACARILPGQKAALSPQGD